jgi:hypothetical protein
MNMYKVRVTYPDEPAQRDPKKVSKLYHGIVGEIDATALFKAQERHEKAGYEMRGAQFKIIVRKIILCGSAIGAGCALPEVAA